MKAIEAKILTNLEYIKEKQVEHDIKIEKLVDSISSQIRICDKRFDVINKEIDTAKGMAKGAIVAGGIGTVGGLSSFFSRLFGGN